MSLKKKIKFRLTKERVILSDVLPYEIPLIFTNRFFYRFLIKNGIEINDENSLIWKDDVSSEVEKVINLLFGCEELNLKKINDQFRIPFTYQIAHKKFSFRSLSVIHPLNQVQIIDFYNRYKSLILYYCNQSNFSLRKPTKVASYFYYKDKLHTKLIGKKVDTKEEFLNEYETIRSFFSYKECSNIYKFYDSEKYRLAEKKYTKLLKIDIQACFDSIYTHSLTWATTGGRDLYKKVFSNERQPKSPTFGDIFDNLMQKINYNETNGILIGPEFSRLFAEIILSYIDHKVESEMKSENLFHHKDYECFRYVDDYFIFYNEESVKDKLYEKFSIKLKEFKLTISEAKTKMFERPFITNISIAKIKIDQLIANSIKFSINKNNFEEKLNITDDGTDFQKEITDIEYFKFEILKKYLNEDINMYLNAANFNVEYHTIVSDSTVEYKDILNYSLSRFCMRFERVLQAIDKRLKYLSYYSAHDKLVGENLENKQNTLLYIDKIISYRKKYERLIVLFTYYCIDVVFFLYSNNKRINTTLKIISILNLITSYFKNNYLIGINEEISRFSKSNISLIFTKIKQEIGIVLKDYALKDNTQLECLYLLIPLKELGNEYNISPSILDEYLKGKKGDLKETECNWNYFIIILLLFYYGGQEQYFKEISFLKKLILFKINSSRKDTESVLLLVDSLSCPYFDKQFKKKVLKKYNPSSKDNDSIISYFDNNRNGKDGKIKFTNWDSFDLNYEIGAKLSQEVYS